MFKKAWMYAALGGLAACGQADSLGDLVDRAAIAEALGGSGQQAPPSEPGSGDGSGSTDTEARPRGDRPPPAMFALDCRMPELRDRVVRNHDANGDGTLDDDEADGIRSDIGEGEGAGGTRPPPPEGMPPPPEGMGPPPPGDQGPRFSEDGPWIDAPPAEPAPGQQPPPPTGGEQQGPRPQGGAHGPGMIMMALVGWIYDADDSRDLSDPEKDLLHADLDARCSAFHDRVLEDFDANDDGTLDDTEQQAARAFGEQLHEQRHQQVLADHDADGDGMLNQEERSAAHEAFRAMIAARHSATLARFDADASGHLEASERTALRTALAERLRAGTPWPEMDNWDFPAGLPPASSI